MVGDVLLQGRAMHGQSASDEIALLVASIVWVSVDTGSGFGPIIVAVEDNDTILDLAGNPLGGPGVGNGSFNQGPAILPIASAATAIALILLAFGFIRLRRRTT